MKILGIETSCDETAAAVVENGTNIISNVIASSIAMHAKTGGIIPEHAAREQVKSIIPVIKESLTIPNNKNHSLKLLSDIDAIAVTVGPGLIGSLLVGVETAKTLAAVTNLPIIPVNHLIGHVYANWITNDPPEFPALALVVSGGHTDLIFIKNHGDFIWLAGTRDDAAGEAFDKCARLLVLPYPGGPSIAKAAEQFFTETDTSPSELKLFPRPLIDDDSLDWSFSGLKTAVLRFTTNKDTMNNYSINQLAAEIQEAIVDVLITKCAKAIEIYKPKSFLLAGGVAANKRLREVCQDELKSKFLRVRFHVPEASLCTDNAAYIASAAFFNQHKTHWQKIAAQPQLAITQSPIDEN